MKICAPIPETLLPEATALWCNSFARFRSRAQVRAENAIVVLKHDRLEGIVGLRDHRGGFLVSSPSLARFLFRPAPATTDLVLDGIVVRRQRYGYCRALILAAEEEARLRHRPGLRAEVRLRNRKALKFYRQLGFVEETRGRFGWPWSGRVIVLRKQV